MRQISDRSIILTFDQIRILLYSLGFDSCEGVFMPGKEFSPQEILKAINSLVNRGLLMLKEEGGKKSDAMDKRPHFDIDPGLREMMLAIGSPGGAFEYRPGEGLPGFSKELYNGPEYYCYILPDYCLVVQRDWTRAESLRLRAMDPLMFSLWRQEREEEAAEQLFRPGPFVPEDEMPGGKRHEEVSSEGRQAGTGDEQDAGGSPGESSGAALSAVL